MSFKLPPSNHPAREAMGDLATLAETLNPANAGKLPVTWQARRSALETFAAGEAFLHGKPGLTPSRINYVVLRQENDQRWLISVGRKGGWKKLWNFGTGRD